MTKGSAVGNYRPIACSNLLWKLLTGTIADKVYKHLDEQHLFSKEKEGCKWKPEKPRITS